MLRFTFNSNMHTVHVVLQFGVYRVEYFKCKSIFIKFFWIFLFTYNLPDLLLFLVINNHKLSLLSNCNLFVQLWQMINLRCFKTMVNTSHVLHKYSKIFYTASPSKNPPVYVLSLQSSSRTCQENVFRWNHRSLPDQPLRSNIQHSAFI